LQLEGKKLHHLGPKLKYSYWKPNDSIVTAAPYHWKKSNLQERPPSPMTGSLHPALSKSPTNAAWMNEARLLEYPLDNCQFGPCLFKNGGPATHHSAPP